MPYGALDFEELCQLVLGLLAHRAASHTGPSAELASLAQRYSARGTPLLLLLDDAGAIPLATLRELVRLARSQGGALRLLAVPVDDRRAGQVLAALGAEVGHVRFVNAMSAAETERYVASRLATACADEPTRERLTPERVSWLHRESAGNPRRLHQLVAWIQHRDGLAPDTPPPLGATGPRLELDPSA